MLPTVGPGARMRLQSARAMNIIAYALFFLAGFGFGFAAPVWARILPFLFPLALAGGAIMSDGMQGEIIARLVLALLITLAGVVIGSLTDIATRRGSTA